jgi:hypothetical protein
VAAVRPPRDADLTILEANAVRGGTAHDYQRRLSTFVAWAAEKQMKLDFNNRESVESCMLEYFDVLAIEEQRTVDAGTKLLAAVGHCHAHLGVAGRGKASCFPRVLRSLQGWNRLLPCGSIDALPEMAVDAIAVELCRKRQPMMALAVVLASDAYLRPGEAVALTKSNLIPPQPSLGLHGRHWSLLMHLEDQAPSKTGVYEDSIILDSPHRAWLGIHLAKLYRGRLAGERLFKFTLDKWNKAFQAATKELGLPRTVLYSLRHAGPTADVLTHRRSLIEVKKRGRWVSDSSVRRYEKAAKSMAIVSKYGINLRTHLKRCTELLPAVLSFNAVAPRFTG